MKDNVSRCEAEIIEAAQNMTQQKQTEIVSFIRFLASQQQARARDAEPPDGRHHSEI